MLESRPTSDAGPMRRGLVGGKTERARCGGAPSDEWGPLRRGQVETQSGSLFERIRRGRAAALPEFRALRAPRFAEVSRLSATIWSRAPLRGARQRSAVVLPSRWGRVGGPGRARSAAV